MSERVLVARCPAKVNLSLRVIGRREDGYHELDTLFQAIDLWDRLEVRPADRLELSCDDPALPTGPSNLVLKAAAALLDLTPDPKPGASFRLVKKIPVQGGLGGGSSDAAGALLLACRLWDLSPPRASLLAIARGLGADVPFFLTGGTAHGTGRGDRVEPIRFLGDIPILLGVPPFGISTRDVFGALASRLTPPPTGVSVRAFSGPKCREDNDFSWMSNDLEGVVFDSWNELREFRDALVESGARGALLSGSGSTVFGVFAPGFDLAPLAEEMRARFGRWNIVRSRAIPRGAHVIDGAADDGV